MYLVGGCVRDLVMKRTPKDFDIITTADLKKVSVAHLDALLWLCNCHDAGLTLALK